MPQTSPHRNAISTPFLQSTPFRIKSSSVPISAKLFKAEDVADDLIVELDNATISESPDSKSNSMPPSLEYIQNFLDSSAAFQSVSLRLSTLKDSAGKLFYKKGCWSPLKIPFFLHRQADLAGIGAASSSRAAKPDPSKATSDPLRSRAPRRTKSSGSLHTKASRTSSRGVRRQTIRRLVGSGSETEEVEGTFISSAGQDEEDTAVWLNGLATSFQSIAFTTPIPALENSSQPHTRGYLKRTSLALASVTPKRLWSAQCATKSIPGAMKIKPDLIFCSNDPLSKTAPTWTQVISFMEVTSKPNDPNMSVNLARKAYAVFIAQPGRRFLMAISISAQVFRLHVYDRSGVIHSCGYNIHIHADIFSKLLYFFAFAQPKELGYNPTFIYFDIIPRPLLSTSRTICVGTEIYIVIRVIFCSQLIHGRATPCLHVRNSHSEDFVIKDCWTHQGRKVTEEQVLQKLKEHGINGLPVLKEAWTVQIDGEDNTTDLRRPPFLKSSDNYGAMCETQVHRRYLLQPLGSPITEFSCLQEFLSIFIDLVHGEFIRSFSDP